jgi:hypothetical protein
MTKSPERTIVTVPRDELERLYVKHGFGGLVASCKTLTICHERYGERRNRHPNTVEMLGLKYRLNGRTIAVIFHYTHNDGTRTRSIRMLLIDDVIHKAPQLPPLQGVGQPV